MSISSGVLHSGKIYDRNFRSYSEVRTVTLAGEKYTFANI